MTNTLREKVDKSITAGFYFRDGEQIRLGEIKIAPTGAKLEFWIDGAAVDVDPRRIYVAEAVPNPA